MPDWLKTIKNALLGTAAVIAAIAVIGGVAGKWFDVRFPPWPLYDQVEKLQIDLLQHRLDYWNQLKIQAEVELEQNPDSEVAHMFYARAVDQVELLKTQLAATGRTGRND